MRLRYCEINCDINLSRQCWENIGPERTMARVIQQAKEAGWRVGPAEAENDACPECRKAEAAA